MQCKLLNPWLHIVTGDSQLVFQPAMFCLHSVSGSRDGTVVRALVSQQYGLGLILTSALHCGLCLVFFLFVCLFVCYLFVWAGWSIGNYTADVNLLYPPTHPYTHEGQPQHQELLPPLFSNSLIIHKVNYKSLHVYHITCMCLDTQWKTIYHSPVKVVYTTKICTMTTCTKSMNIY